MRLIAVTHQSSSIAELERAALDAAGAAAIGRELAGAGIEAMALATCGRTELYWRSRGSDDDARVLAAFRARTGAANGGGPAPLAGEPVARHLFRVACGLESQVLGESEILGQIRDALELSGARGFLAGVVRAALRCGGRARAETAIGAGSLSVASSAVRLVADGAGLGGRTVLVVGAGDTGLKAARHLRAEGVGRLLLANRTRARAEAAAAELGAEVAALEELPALLVGADAAVLAVRRAAPLVTASLLRDVLAARAGRPLTLVDVSLPRAVDPAAAGLAGLVLRDLSAIEDSVRASLEQRRAEIARVDELVEHELRWLHVWSHQELIRPMLAEMRERVEVIRRAEVEYACRDGAGDSEAMDRLTRRLVDRLLAIPATLLKNGHFALDAEHVHYLRALFGAAPTDERA